MIRSTAKHRVPCAFLLVGAWLTFLSSVDGQDAALVPPLTATQSEPGALVPAPGPLSSSIVFTVDGVSSSIDVHVTATRWRAVFLLLRGLRSNRPSVRLNSYERATRRKKLAWDRVLASLPPR